MVDMSEYKDEFVSEARDHLDTLNETLLILEKDSEDMENINKTFRAFHTLKGNAATMGFKKFSELAHHLEDVLDKVRNNELKVNKNMVDVIFSGVDLLEAGLQMIQDDQGDDIEFDSITESVEEIIGKKEVVISVDIGELVKLTDDEKKKSDLAIKDGKHIFRIILLFDKDNMLKIGKALIILRDITSMGEIVKINPSQEDIKAGKFTEEIEIVISTEKEKVDISTNLNKVSGIKSDFVLDLDEKYQKPINDIVISDDKSKDKSDEKKPTDKKAPGSVVKTIDSVKVNMTKLDVLMNLIGELLIYNIRLQDISKKHQLGDLNVILKAIDRLTLELQDEIMEVRMVPIGNVFNRFPRMVRDLAGKQKKKIEFIMSGQEIEFDRTVLDQIGDPLVHMLRNSVDHGIETPEERIEKGKSETGVVKLIARREKNNAIIDIIDDGAGIDPKLVKESCIRKGSITKEEADKMTDNQLQMLIFRPGVSTNTVITDISGRGVGMDVVITKIKQLGGQVKLESVVGKGSTMSLQLPLTLAIVTCLMVKVNDSVYAIPLTSIERTVDIEKSSIKTIQNNEVFVLRGIDIPLLWMHELFGGSRKELDKMTVVIVNYNESQVGLVVDEITSQQQILIKSLQDIVKGTKGVAGATILGNGNVSLILDIDSLLS